MSPIHAIYEGMTDKHENKRNKFNWGPWLFFGVLFLVLTFFWWLLIYSGGVGGHHG